jgi:hypothetical protein
MPPQDEGVVITVSDRHIVICRRRHLPNGSVMYECAQNAADLELDAMVAVAKGQRPFMTGQEFTCPPELAARAQWS